MKRYKIIYQKNSIQRSISMFDPSFVSKNKYKCKILYKNKIYPLKHEFIIPTNFILSYKEKIDLIFLDTYRINLNWMFANCDSLLEINESPKEQNLIKLTYDFKKEKRAKFKTDESNNIINNFCNNNYYFFYPEKMVIRSILSLEIIEISKYRSNILQLPNYFLLSKPYNNFNITSMKGIFYECIYLKKINLSSLFNTNNVKDMSYMFYGCSSLSLLPDISKWDFSNVTDMSFMFADCNSLPLPDTSKWNINTKVDMSNMFYISKPENSSYHIEREDLTYLDDKDRVPDEYILFQKIMLYKELYSEYLEYSKNPAEYEEQNRIFSINYLKKNKHKYKIIYKNKLYPLEKLYSDEDIDNSFKLLYLLNEKNFKKNSEYKIVQKYQKIHKKIIKFPNIYAPQEENLDLEINKNYIFKFNYLLDLKFKFYDSLFISYNKQPNSDKIKIFGKNFVENNKDKCIILYNNILYFLEEFLLLDDQDKRHNDNIEIIYIELENIPNRSYMFHECIDLKEISLLKDKKNISNQKEITDNNIKSIKDEPHLNLYINDEPIIKKKQTNDMISEFKISGFKNNAEIVENNINENENNIISEFYNREVTDINYMFYKCSSLTSLYDISKYKTDKVTNMNYLFYDCNELISIPDISKWNTFNVTDMSYIFSGCSNLISLPDISKWNTNNVTKMNYSFAYCSSLLGLPNISKWNTNNVTSMYNIFSGCRSLITLPDISNWNISKITKMSEIFNECSSLVSLPDISKWNTNNVTYMNNIFSGCSSLVSLPDISKWNTNNVTDMSYMFSKCSKLKLLPDISKWNISIVYTMSCMFKECTDLISLPDISKWNTKSMKNISCMFSGCSSLISLPDISKWNTENIKTISDLFYECTLLKSVPDISKWNTKNIIDMICSFYKCKSLISIPDISKWNTNNVGKINYMFSECSSLISLPDISKWNTSKITRMDYMFNGCLSLISLPDLSKWNTNEVDNISHMFYNCPSLIVLPNINFDFKNISSKDDYI